MRHLVRYRWVYYEGKDNIQYSRVKIEPYTGRWCERNMSRLLYVSRTLLDISSGTVSIVESFLLSSAVLQMDLHGQGEVDIFSSWSNSIWYFRIPLYSN